MLHSCDLGRSAVYKVQILSFSIQRFQIQGRYEHTMANMAIEVKCNLNTCRYDGANKFSMPLQFENPFNKHLFMQIRSFIEGWGVQMNWCRICNLFFEREPYKSHQQRHVDRASWIDRTHHEVFCSHLVHISVQTQSRPEILCSVR